MPGVAKLASASQRSAEADRQGPIQGNPECDPQLQRDTLTVAELDAADPSLPDAHPAAQLGLREAKANSCAPDSLTEVGRQDVGQARRIPRLLGGPTATRRWGVHS